MENKSAIAPGLASSLNLTDVNPCDNVALPWRTVTTTHCHGMSVCVSVLPLIVCNCRFDKGPNTFQVL